MLIGSLLQERYRIESVLGQGGMGSVYLGTHLHLNRKVAIKQLYVVTDDADMDEAAFRQFKHEAQLLQQLNHPRLPKVYDYIEIERNPYLIMEYVQGRTLNSVVGEEGPLPEAQVQQWALALCDVLQYLHQHKPPVIFRDLKPSNVMLDAHGEVRLIDFGISKFLDPLGRTKTFARGAGSPGYSAPEQYSGTTDARSDIFSLGATLYALLTRTVPPSSVEVAVGVTELPLLHTLRPDLHTEFADAIHQCLQIRASDRPDTVQEVRELLVARQAAPPPQAQPAVTGRRFASVDTKSASRETTARFQRGGPGSTLAPPVRFSDTDQLQSPSASKMTTMRVKRSRIATWQPRRVAILVGYLLAILCLGFGCKGLFGWWSEAHRTASPAAVVTPEDTDTPEASPHAVRHFRVRQPSPGP